MQDREEIRQLFERYRQGKCTPDEQAQLNAWFNRYASQEAHGLDELQKAYETDQAVLRRRGFMWLPYAAAVIAMVALVGAWLLLDSKKQTSGAEVIVKDVAPGGNRAMLTLADGRTVNLSEAQEKIIVGDEITYADGSEVVDVRNKTTDIQGSGNGDFSSNISRIMSLKTPKGGTYQITLPDGTKVWLNAASILRYPVRFEGNERIVEIEGEGYFSVVSDKGRPFKIISKEQKIEVLGTEFNISAYPDDDAAKTTLVGGKVKVSSLLQAGTEEVLIPGEQAITHGAAMDVQTVDVAQYIAWKDGNFHFDNISLADLMKQISRWYDVEVIYRNKVPQERFSGGMSRDVTLRTVLELLRISEIKYRIESNKLIIE
ncbi:FecR family protein [Parapedobacter indicus]|uniref:FecR family protein n=1 Tax=Parapedobacter indicus TaxID=1477437 RepID=A0A1I3PSZ5_9SPHI|nr:FecR family protein [Parapedobacter indicus]PPL00557.1 FecR family protein [Parapedobacter indicus]SFJ24502.1 FecR family protein [Parapedobacter indicus]